jgi:hypothetical protein
VLHNACASVSIPQQPLAPIITPLYASLVRSSRIFHGLRCHGRDLAGAISLGRHSVVGAIKKALELISEGCRDVRVTAPDGRIWGHKDFESLAETRSDAPRLKGGEAPRRRTRSACSTYRRGKPVQTTWATSLRWLRSTQFAIHFRSFSRIA